MTTPEQLESQAREGAVRVTFVSSHARQGGAERSLTTLLSALPAPWVAGVVCLEHGPLVEELRRRRFPTSVLSTGAGGLSIARSALRLRRVLRRTAPAVVHANGIKAALVSVLAALGTGRAVLWMKHDYSWDGPLARVLASRCAAVVGVSRAVTEALPARLGGRVHVVHNALAEAVPEREAAAARLRELLGAEAGEPIVTLVGRLDPPKGQRELLAVAPEVLEHTPSTHFLFVGGEHEPHLDYAARLRREGEQLADAVRFLGHRDDAFEIIAGSDVVVVPTVVYRGFGRESFSLVALEAMAAGTPVVGYADGGLPEVLADCGRLVAPGDRRALADAIAELLADPALRERLARCGRDRAAREFSVERMTAAMKEHYRAAANGTRLSRDSYEPVR